jgi:hypothetical protein
MDKAFVTRVTVKSGEIPNGSMTNLARTDGDGVADSTLIVAAVPEANHRTVAHFGDYI